MVTTVEWPHDADDIWQALLERPVPATRNWYPDGHVEAIRLGYPHGQTPDELRQETRDYENSEAA